MEEERGGRRGRGERGRGRERGRREEMGREEREEREGKKKTIEVPEERGKNKAIRHTAITTRNILA